MTTFAEATQATTGLRDFQRDTVDWVFRRLYTDADWTRRFLIADEVGLGKTLVAKGIIARAVEDLRAAGKRAGVVYVCSNGAIAQQNIRRLALAGDNVSCVASRLTLLARDVRDLRGNEVTFVSFTPNTTFELGDSLGRADERALLHQLLSGEGELKRSGLRNLLQGNVGKENWDDLLLTTVAVDERIASRFLQSVRETLWGKLTEACLQFGRIRDSWPEELRAQRNAVTGCLRSALARASLAELDPDLIILDEFQRFKDLLHGESEAAQLAAELFRQPRARVLLLSATPYKMLTLWHDEADDHYSDFIETLRFLFNGDAAPLERVRQLLDNFRRLLLGASAASREELGEVRDELRRLLLQVMVRTERVGMTSALDAMLTERCVALVPNEGDLSGAVAVDSIAQDLRAGDTVEYWKSSPYPLTYLSGYELRRKLDSRMDRPDLDLASRVRMASGALLPCHKLSRYRRIDFANARLRELVKDTVERGMWRLLWLPPSLPYWALSHEYRDAATLTKALVFCGWNLAPDAIATLCSYEAERRVVDTAKQRDWSASTFHDKVKPPLRFQRRDEHLSGMSNFALLYPSPALAGVFDPLRAAVESGAPPAPKELLREIAATLRPRLDLLPESASRSVDVRWYWAAPALLDQESAETRAWADDPTGWERVLSGRKDDDSGDAAPQYLELWRRTRDGLERLGRKPADLDQVLARMVIASPAVCALRALHRVAPDLPFDDPRLLQAAATVADALRTLFNNPETVVLLRGRGNEAHYWRLVLQHAINGNLQAVLDEQCHVLVESLGVGELAPRERVEKIAEEIGRALGIRTALLKVDDIVVRDDAVTLKPYRIRCRFALRLGDLKDDDGKEIARADVVRAAFNSPFRPFVLATTSIGQEGLDFHTWCHAVVHWNLPTNPVDLEQREGRVHRYKGHAVRKNVARKLGLRTLADVWDRSGDPWAALFEEARRTRPRGSNDLVPYWIYETEGGATIERRIPMLAFSREVSRLERLRRGLALYRLAFGQPRQEDLLGHLDSMREVDAQWVSDCHISLQPPRLR